MTLGEHSVIKVLLNRTLVLVLAVVAFGAGGAAPAFATGASP